MAERSIDEQFAALPDAIKSRLFRILDVVLGASHDEKDRARHMLTQRYDGELPEPVPALLNAVAALVVHADAQAGGDYTPEELDREPKPVLEAIAALMHEIQLDPELALGTGLVMATLKDQVVVDRDGRPSDLLGKIAHLVTTAAEVALDEKGSDS